MEPPDFTEFVAARGAQLHRSALLLTTSPHAAEDLVQAALLRVYAAWDRVRGADDPTAYAHRVLLNTFLSDRRRRSSTELVVAEVHDDRATPDPSSAAAQRVVVLAALADLAPVDRAVVVLRYLEDRSVGETADLLGLSVPAVKSRSLRAVRALRPLLADLSPSRSHS